MFQKRLKVLVLETLTFKLDSLIFTLDVIN